MLCMKKKPSKLQNNFVFFTKTNITRLNGRISSNKFTFQQFSKFHFDLNSQFEVEIDRNTQPK